MLMKTQISVAIFFHILRKNFCLIYNVFKLRKSISKGNAMVRKSANCKGY